MASNSVAHGGGGGSRGDRDPSHRRFPDGLRVLLIDEDTVSLLAMESHLRAFKYKVTRCIEAHKALPLIRENKNKIDIILIDIHNSAVDVFKFLSQVESEMNIPVVVISAEDSVESVVEVMKKGACDYLIKPVRPEALRMIYKHVAKRVAVEVNAAADDSSSGGEGGLKDRHKRNRTDQDEGDDNNHHEDECDTEHTSKKRRVVWSPELRDKFIAAVNQLGLEKAVPKKILEIMNVPGLTRENVASHLQKYRLHLKKQSDHGEEMSRPFIMTAHQEGTFYNNEAVFSATPTGFYRRQAVQFPHHMNSVFGVNPHLSSHWQNPSPVLTQLVPQPMSHPLRSDGVSVAVSGRNGMRHPQRVLEFCDFGNTEDGNVISSYHTEDAETMGLMQNENMFEDMNLEDVGLFPLPEPSLSISQDLPSSQVNSWTENIPTMPVISPGIEAHPTSSVAVQTRYEYEFPNQHSALHQQENVVVDRDGRLGFGDYSTNNNLT